MAIWSKLTTEEDMKMFKSFKAVCEAEANSDRQILKSVQNGKFENNNSSTTKVRPPNEGGDDDADLMDSSALYSGVE